MNTGYILAFDFGTSGVKAVLVDRDKKIYGTSTVGYPLSAPQPGWAEQDPDELWKATCKAAGQAVGAAGVRPEEVKDVVYGTYWKAVIPIDEDGNVLHKAVIWLDARAGVQAQELNGKMGIDYMYPAEYFPRLLWFLQEKPDVYEKTKYFLEANAYLKYRATGVIASDFNNNFIKSGNQRIRRFSERFLKATGIDESKFPPLVQSSDKVGCLTEQAATDMGLAAGANVYGGNTDIAAIAIGSGCTRTGQGHVYMGSSGWIGTTIEEQDTDQLYPFLHFYPGKELLLGGMQAVGIAFNHTLQCFYGREQEEYGERFFDYLENEIKDIPAGSEGLISQSFLFGEAPPFSANAGGSFVNIRSHHDRRHFVTATMEGIACHFRFLKERNEMGGLANYSELTVVGGCTGSAKWMQIMADVMNIRIIVMQNARHAGAVGTAMCAVVGEQYGGDFSKIEVSAETAKVYMPDPEKREIYDALYEQWQRIDPALSDLYGDIKENSN